MRPTANTEPFSRHRKRSLDQAAPVMDTRPSNPTTFFLARGSDQEDSSEQKPQVDQADNTDSTQPPVDSQDIQSSAMDADSADQQDSSATRDQENNTSAHMKSISAIKRSPSVNSQTDHIPSQPLTPLLFGSPADGSLPSSPKSVSTRSMPHAEVDSTADETGSQAIVSSEEEDQDNRNSVPQLVMPSIKMPSRRPFTARGKELGRLKILVTGGRRLGKTSLIKSIVQVCEDIVHVDPIQNGTDSKMSQSELPVTSSTPSTSANNKSEPKSASTPRITEVFASTKPYPPWWSDHEIHHNSRRKSMGDSILERNICFAEASCSDLEPLLSYMEHQLYRSSLTGQATRNDLVGLLSGRGGSQVDVILYLLSKDTLQTGLRQMKQLSKLCTVIPVVSRADLLNPEQVKSFKEEVISCMASESIPSPLLPTSSTAEIPYAVSTTNSPDNETMDASLLMSSEYIQPLLPSELSLLVERLFDKENIAYLRHSSAKLLLSWKTHRSTALASSPSSPQSSSSTSPSSQTGESKLNTSNSHSLARLADHTQHEEKLAHVRLTQWANELQKSLQRERERYESLARGERAIWLVDRMGEELKDGSLVSVQGRTNLNYQQKAFAHSTTTHDPLGLLHWGDTLQTSGWLALQIVGSLGVVGGLTLWLAKSNGVGPWN